MLSTTLHALGRAVRFGGLGAILAVASAAAASDDGVAAAPRRPRVGLVLAGGGARGLAHVGVIRLLEELNVQVDYVAGTSMGSIVGGLYAAGYTADEMLAWVNRCDWDVLLSDLPARQSRGFRAKEEELETPRWIEFGIGKSGLKTPKALVSGQNLLFALRDQTSLVASIDSFDELPLPFRAVATDVETGDMVVLEHGPLADAMRASMAVPGMFAPHTIDDRVLIDGFASRNLPVSVARDMGADVIIAVDVRADLKTAEELGNPLAMVNQLMSILSQKDTLEQIATLKESDVLVRLKLPGYSTSAFRNGADLVELGYAEAQEMRAALVAMSVGSEAYATFERARRSRRYDPPVIAAIEVEAGSHVAQDAVRARLAVEVGQPLDEATLERSLQRVYDLGYFELVDHRIEKRPTGDVLVVSAREKPWGPNFAIFGLGFRSDLDGESELDVKTSMRFTQLNRLGGELAVRGAVGSIDELEVELFQPVEYSGQFFIAPVLDYLKKPEHYTDDVTEILPGAPPLVLDFSRQSAFAGLEAGVRFGSHGELRFGCAHGSIDYSEIRGPLIVIVDANGNPIVVDYSSVLQDYSTDRWTAALTFDRLDDAFFPRRGYYLNAYSDVETGSLGSSTAGLFALMPARFGEWVVQSHLNANYTLASDRTTGRLPFRVGGLFNLSGLAPDEVYGANALVGGVIVRKPLNAGGSLFVGGSLEAGNAWDEVGDTLPDSWIVSASLFLAAKTPIGPIHLATGLADGQDVALYLYLGRVIP